MPEERIKKHLELLCICGSGIVDYRNTDGISAMGSDGRRSTYASLYIKGI
jgi:hypothetical protein